MNSLERVAAAIAFQPTDRVPVIAQVFGHAAALADVPLDDYVQNLRGFRETASRCGAQVVYLTRPHLPAIENLEPVFKWRLNVPSYNEALRRFARESGDLLVDVQAEFATRDVFADECHLTPQGLCAMAEFVCQELQRHSDRLHFAAP